MLRVGLVAGALLITLGASPSTARACSMVPGVEAFEPTDSTDTVAPTLRSAQLLIRRAEEPAVGQGDCRDLGSYRVVVDATEDVTEATDFGYELTLVRGTGAETRTGAAGTFLRLFHTLALTIISVRAR